MSALLTIAQGVFGFLLLLWLLARWAQRTADAQRTAAPAPPSAVTITAAEASARRREEVETRPRVTAAGALNWLGTDGLRDLAGRVLSDLEPPAPRP
jgi:hypothetical protein